MGPLAVKDVVTSPLSLARVLWWYGEDDLWRDALGLAPVVVADLSPRFAELRNAPAVVELMWPGARSRTPTSSWARSNTWRDVRDQRPVDTDAAYPCPTS